MRIPNLILATLLAVAAVGAFPTAAANTCATAEPVAPNDTRAGVVALEQSNWYQHLASGTATYVLTPQSGTDIDLFVWSDCSEFGGWLCDSQNEGAAQETCTVSGGSNYRVEVYGYEAGSYTITFSGQAITECGDGVDNDGDGRTDYPSDPGCGSVTDPTEGPGCPEVAPSLLVCLEASTIWLEQPLNLVDVTGSGDRIAGYLDIYLFTVGGVTVAVPCVTLLVDGSEISPCAEAGGVFDSRSGTLVDQEEPTVVPSPLLVVRVCNAELTATYAGIGVRSAPAYTLC